jgi:hypothetical protein
MGAPERLPRRAEGPEAPLQGFFCRKYLRRVPALPTAHHRLVAWAPLVAVLVAGCASAPARQQEQPAPTPQAVTQSPPSPPPAQARPPAAAPPRPAAAVVIDPGGETSRDGGLAAAADAERRRRLQSTEPVVRITDQNLSSHAVGKLTFSDAGALEDASSGGTAEEAVAAAAETGGDEALWRNRIRELRLDWREATDRIAELERQASDLRHRFYAEDDPYRRDGQIKPAWDHALESLEQARRSAREARERLEQTLLEGAQAGALPGWLREGLDLEPARGVDEPTGRARATGELVVIEPRVGEEEGDWP